MDKSEEINEIVKNTNHSDELDKNAIKINKKKAKKSSTGECKFCGKFIKIVKIHEAKCEIIFASQSETIVTKDGEKRFLCNICKETFKSIIGLRFHKPKHDPPGGYICNCGERFCMKQDLEKHKEIKHMVYKCQLCQSSFTTKETYVDHVKTVHDGQDREYRVCEDCGKQFKSKSLLHIHKQSMCGTTKPFKCDVCGSNFRNQWSLKTHKLLHESEKQFCCSYCGNKYITKSRLAKHERTHTQEKAFVCEVCNKGFAHAESLVTHSTLHTGIKPYVCECCGARFSCISNILQHRRRRPDSCGLPQYCQKITKAAPRARVQTASKYRKKQPVMCFKRLSDDISKNKRVKKSTKISKEQIEMLQLSPSHDSDNEELLLMPENSILEDQQTIKSSEIVDSTKIPNDVKCEAPEESVFQIGDPLNCIDVQIKEETPEEIINTLDKCEFNQLKDNTDKCLEPTDCEIKREHDDSEFDYRGDYSEFLVDQSKAESFDVKDIKTLDLINIKIEDKKDNVVNNDTVENTSLSFETLLKNPKRTRQKSLRVELTTKSKKFKTRRKKRSKISDDSSEEIEINLKKLNRSDYSYECNKCPKIFDKRMSFIAHCTKEHEMQQTDIEEQLSKNNYGNPSQCKYCGKRYSMKKCLEEHLLLHGPNGEFIHKCSVCTKYFKTPTDVTEHCKTDHFDKLTCNICTKFFATITALKFHLKRKHENIKMDFEKKKTFVCQNCGRNFSNVTILNDHEKSNCGKNPLYECKICGKRLHTAGTLKTHENIHTKKVLHTCTECNRSFQTPYQLQRHSRSHTGEKPFKCQYCDKAYPYVESLYTHLSVHTGVKRYACNGCGDRFACISNLQNHRRTHADTCGKLTLQTKPTLKMSFVNDSLKIG